jgi:molybdopterin synthase sulfur carrier subunit
MQVRIPGLLRSYTRGAETVAVESGAPSATLAGALAELDARFPGFRFRIVDEQGAIRPHIKMFVDGELARSLETSTRSARELMIVGALSGG